MSRVATLSCHSARDLSSKVSAIKGVRGLSGLGLKEAKELVERVNPGNSEIINIDHNILEPKLSEYIELIRAGGLEVRLTKHNDPVRKAIGEDIRKLVTYCTISAQYDIGKALIDILETYCPEPSDSFEAPEEE